MSLLTKLWNDPVWSKVIATSIIATGAFAISYFSPPVAHFFLYLWSWVEQAYDSVTDNIFILTTFLLGLALIFVIYRQKSNRYISNNARTNEKAIGINWFKSLDEQQFSRYAFLIWFPLNHSLRTPRYYLRHESIDHIPEIHELIQRQVIAIHRDNVIRFTVRIDDQVYYYLDSKLHDEYPQLSEEEKRALENIRNSDFGLMIRGRSRVHE